ncbi:MAG: Sec-independent protein translocase subunit TatB [Betaproteobacteria bacterium]|nr:Sec-independent protein translocase subunit TatB [Betaproteobacteria bacterium]
MFDIGFSELMVIAVVALIVIGPQRLPTVARTLGHLLGRMQRYVNDVKADISREMELDELKKMQSSVEDAARSMRDSVTREVSEAEGELNKLARSAQPGADPYADPFADSPPPDAAAPASPQAELPLETTPHAPAQKQA